MDLDLLDYAHIILWICEVSIFNNIWKLILVFAV